MHAVFAAAEQRRARLQGRAAVGVRGAWKNTKTRRHGDVNPDFFSFLHPFDFCSISFDTNKKSV